MYGFLEHVKREERLLSKMLGDPVIGSASKPEGYLIIRHSRNGDGVSFGRYQVEADGICRRRSRMLGPLDSYDALDFARKEFLSKLRQSAEHNIGLIRKIAPLYMPYSIDDILDRISSASRLVLLNSSDYSFLLSNYDSISGFEKNSSGLQTVVPPNRKIGFAGRYSSVTPQGQQVRSKGEAIIGMSLEHHCLRYEHERPLELRDENGFKVVRYPDFTIWYKNKVFYWEHLGMVSDHDYLMNNAEKIKLYHQNGIVLWDNLIITMDGPDGGINAEAIDKIIEHFIMCNA